MWGQCDRLGGIIGYHALEMCLYYVYCFYVVLGLGSGHTDWRMSDTCAVCHQPPSIKGSESGTTSRLSLHCWLVVPYIASWQQWLMKRESPLMGKDCIWIDIDRYWGFTRCSHVLGLLYIQESMQLMFSLGNTATLHIKQLPCWRLFLAGVEGKGLKLWHPRLPESNFTKGCTLALGLGM